jgi:hypothetical protein
MNPSPVAMQFRNQEELGCGGKASPVSNRTEKLVVTIAMETWRWTVPANTEQTPWPLQGEERDRIFRSLRRVGPQKLIGYLPLNTISVVLGSTPEDVEGEAARKGLGAIRFDPDDCRIKSGAIYVYDREHLQQFLSGVSATLSANDWPLAYRRALAAQRRTRGWLLVLCPFRGTTSKPGLKLEQCHRCLGK